MTTMNPTELFDAVQHALSIGQTARAGELAKYGVASGIRHPNILTLAAYALWGESRSEDALKLLENAREMTPRDPNVLHLMGLCRAHLGDAAGAVQAYEAAIAAEPGFAPPYYNLGSLKQEIGEIEAARALYNKVLTIDPNYSAALAALADLDAKAGRYPQARKLGEQALAINPNEFAAISAIASSDLAGGDPAKAEARLRAAVDEGALSPLNQAIAENLLGDALDAQDRIAEAFENYAVSKLRMQALYTPLYGLSDTESALAQAQRLAAEFEAIAAETWKKPPPGDPAGPAIKSHIFLLSFPRSGTTLLEQVLASHPAITTIEEADTLGDAYAEAIKPAGGLGRFAQADGAELERLRRAYWDRVSALGLQIEGQVVVDKLPINTINLPVIARLFPKAKILFARRDPRDVALSAFRRRIGMNLFMFQLLSLDGTARYYDAVMTLAETYIARLPLELHVVSYEEVVKDFQKEITAACRFIGVDWEDAMRGFAAAAKARDINTPSSAQVARGLYREGVGQWRRYAAEMAPVLPILQPWVERFGYPAK
jgi:tetratricopeptide (TPR) repeat protein